MIGLMMRAAELLRSAARGATQRRIWPLLAGVGVLALAGLLLGPGSSSQFRGELAGLGFWELPATLAVGALLVCALVPVPLVAGACGLLFGAGLGGVAATTALSLGGALAYGAARLTRGPVRGSRRGMPAFAGVLTARIAPAMPFALVSYASGVARVGLVEFTGATILGVAPRAFVYAALGGSLGDYTSPKALMAALALAALAVIGAVVGWRGRARILTVITGGTDARGY